MTEDQRRRAVAALFERAGAADRRGLFLTGKLWRDFACHLATMRAADLVTMPDIVGEEL